LTSPIANFAVIKLIRDVDIISNWHGQRAEVDLDYNDSIHLSIATNIVVNFPQPRFAVLPVNLGVEVLGFGGTVSTLPLP
jgi:hypothetical protein